MALQVKTNKNKSILNRENGSSLIETLVISPVFLGLSFCILLSIYLFSVRTYHDHLHYELVNCLHQYNKMTCENWFKNKTNIIPFGTIKILSNKKQIKFTYAETVFQISSNNNKNFMEKITWRIKFGMQSPKWKNKRWPLTPMAL